MMSNSSYGRRNTSLKVDPRVITISSDEEDAVEIPQVNKVVDNLSIEDLEIKREKIAEELQSLTDGTPSYIEDIVSSSEEGYFNLPTLNKPAQQNEASFQSTSKSSTNNGDYLNKQRDDKARNEMTQQTQAPNTPVIIINNSNKSPSLDEDMMSTLQAMTEVQNTNANTCQTLQRQEQRTQQQPVEAPQQHLIVEPQQMPQQPASQPTPLILGFPTDRSQLGNEDFLRFGDIVIVKANVFEHLKKCETFYNLYKNDMPNADIDSDATYYKSPTQNKKKRQRISNGESGSAKKSKPHQKPGSSTSHRTSGEDTDDSRRDPPRRWPKSNYADVLKRIIHEETSISESIASTPSASTTPSSVSGLSDDTDASNAFSVESVHSVQKILSKRARGYAPPGPASFKQKYQASNSHDHNRTAAPMTSNFGSSNNDEHLLVPCSAFKNTDSSLYFNSDTVRACKFCHKKYTRMVSHIKHVHSDCEVFVSRVSPKMAAKVKAVAQRFVKYRGARSILMLKAECIFCESEKMFSTMYWEQHIRSHTGEYANICDICKQEFCFDSSSHCSLMVVRRPEFDRDPSREALRGFICNDCNFVQISEKNMVEHLRHQHDYSDSDLSFLQPPYTKIIILPAMDCLPLQSILPDVTSNARSARIGSVSINSMHVQLTQPNNGIQILNDQIIRTANAYSENWQSPYEHRWSTLQHEFDQVHGMPHEDTQTNNNDTNRTNNGLNRTNSGSNVQNISKSLKTDIYNDRQLKRLMEIQSNGDSASTERINVRPWIDADWATKPPFTFTSLLCTYKCMYDQCVYATNDEENWKAHMIQHLDLIDALEKQRSDIFTERSKLRFLKFRECSYCTYEPRRNYQLKEHITEEHRGSRFQCSFCFYRAFELDYMTLHNDKFHNDESTREILLVREHQEDNSEWYPILSEACDNNVAKIKCCQAVSGGICDETFININNIYSHLLVCHGADPFICPYCNTPVDCKPQLLREHLLSYHSFKEFECIFCEYNSNDVNEIREHMSLHHPSKPLFIATRFTRTPDAEPEEAQLVYIGNMLDHSRYTLWTCSNHEALNKMNPNELDISMQQAEIISNAHLSTKELFEGQIPPFIPDSAIPFLNFEDYQKWSSRKTMQAVNEEQADTKHSLAAYICIDTKVADDLLSISKSHYKSRLCIGCNAFNEIKDGSDINSYLEHLIGECTGNRCARQYSSVRDVIRHRFKSKDHLTQKCTLLQRVPILEAWHLVVCAFKCAYCSFKGYTYCEIIKHHGSKHVNHFMIFHVAQNSTLIHSRAQNSPVYQTSRISIYKMFHCQKCDRSLGTTEDATQHYYEKHMCEENFEIQLKTYVDGEDLDELKLKSTGALSLHVLKCSLCAKNFSSIDKKCNHDELALGTHFTIEKLVACPIDKTISTTSGLKLHCSIEHADKQCCPVNVMHPKMCALCSLVFISLSDLKPHYRKKHEYGENLTDPMLEELDLIEIEVTECKYSPGCCPTMRFDLVDQVVNHVSVCGRRFKCECPNSNVQNASEFTRHCRREHASRAEELTSNLYSIKHFVALFFDLSIFFPNGLGVTKCTIEGTKFYDKLEKKLYESVLNTLEREQKYANCT